MLNNELIVSRIKKLMDDNSLNPSSFANKIGSKRANVSHILSGRNKPSLNFLIKIVESFDGISLDWFRDNSVVPLENYKALANQNIKITDENAGKINMIVHFYENGTFKIFKNAY